MLYQKQYEVLCQDNITGVAKLRFASRMRLFKYLHAALLSFPKNHILVFHFFSIAKCRNFVKWYCDSYYLARCTAIYFERYSKKKYDVTEA